MKKLVAAVLALALPIAAYAADPTPVDKCCCCEKKAEGEMPCCDKMKHDAKHDAKTPADPHAGHNMSDHH